MSAAAPSTPPRGRGPGSHHNNMAAGSNSNSSGGGGGGARGMYTPPQATTGGAGGNGSQSAPRRARRGSMGIVSPPSAGRTRSASAVSARSPPGGRRGRGGSWASPGHGLSAVDVRQQLVTPAVSAMEWRRQPCFIRWRVCLLILISFQVFVGGGVIYGWAALESAMLEEGIYSSYCDTTGDSSSSSSGASTPHHHQSCQEQLLHLNALYVAASWGAQGSGVLGFVLDRFGIKYTISGCSLLMAVASAVFALSSPEHFNAYLPALLGLGMGGCGIYLAAQTIGDLFRRNQNLALFCVSGCFAPGVLIFQSFQILTSKGISSLRVLFLAYAALQAVLTLVSFLAWPHTFANPLTAPEKLDEAHARQTQPQYLEDGTVWRPQHGNATKAARSPADRAFFKDASWTVAKPEPEPLSPRAMDSPSRRLPKHPVLRVGDDDDVVGGTSGATAPDHVRGGSGSQQTPPRGRLSQGAPLMPSQAGHSTTSEPLLPGGAGTSTSTTPVTSTPSSPAPPSQSRLTEADSDVLADASWGGFWRQLKTSRYIGLAVFFSLQLLPAQFYLGTVGGQVSRIEKTQAKIDDYIQYFNIVYSLVALATPLFGAAVDRLGFGVGMIVTNTCLLASQLLLGYAPSSPWLFLSYVLYTIGRSAQFSIFFSYIGSVFGYTHIGKLMGVGFLMSAMVSLLQSPVLALVLGPLHGSYAHGDVLLGIVLVLYYVYAVWVLCDERKRLRQQQSGHTLLA